MRDRDGAWPPDIFYFSLLVVRHEVRDPVTGDHHSRYDQPRPHTPGPGAWKQIGWNFQIIPTFLPVGPLLPHTLHGSSLLHTWEQHANSKTSPHTTSIREGVNMVPTTTNFSNSDFPFSSLSTPGLTFCARVLCEPMWVVTSLAWNCTIYLEQFYTYLNKLFNNSTQEVSFSRQKQSSWGERWFKINFFFNHIWSSRRYKMF